MKNQWIRHVAGEFVNKMQFCVVCGKTLIDYRNVMWTGNSAPKGWKEGDVFQKGNMTTVVLPEEDFQDCLPQPPKQTSK